MSDYTVTFNGQTFSLPHYGSYNYMMSSDPTIARFLNTCDYVLYQKYENAAVPMINMIRLLYRLDVPINPKPTSIT
jgi:hypothetical protein